MSTSQWQFKIWCETDNKWEYTFVESINEPSKPGVCPVNAGHTVTAASETLIGPWGASTVKIDEGTGGTGKIYINKWKVTINPGIGVRTTADLTFPIPVWAFSAKFTTTSVHEGDSFYIHTAPNTTVGVLTAGASIGDTTFTVSSTVVQNTFLGMLVKLVGGTTNECGMITNIDSVNSQITVETATTDAFDPFTTLVQITVQFAKLEELGPRADHHIGNSMVGATKVPASTIIRCIYDNTTGGEKEIHFYWDLNVGGSN
jgi:hypothetical protein